MSADDHAELISDHQHCTSAVCPYTNSHTARWCGYEQPRRCDCAFCYGGTAEANTETVARVITAIGGPWSEHTPLSIAQALTERFHITERQQ